MLHVNVNVNAASLARKHAMSKNDGVSVSVDWLCGYLIVPLSTSVTYTVTGLHGYLPQYSVQSGWHTTASLSRPLSFEPG